VKVNAANRIAELIFAAMRESNAAAAPGRVLEISATTVLVGDTGKLDSLGFVNLVASIEDNIERAFHTAISVMDIILSADGEEWTVADLAGRVAEQLPATQASDAMA
jgi:acyl carrier protein